jgi:hypothetical protein
MKTLLLALILCLPDPPSVPSTSCTVVGPVGTLGGATGILDPLLVPDPTRYQVVLTIDFVYSLPPVPVKPDSSWSATWDSSLWPLESGGHVLTPTVYDPVTGRYAVGGSECLIVP